MKLPPELREKLLKEKGISGVSEDPNGFINVYVETQDDAKELLLRTPKIMGFQVRPIVTGRIKIMERTSRIRPILPGISISHPKSTSGTLGFIAKDKITKQSVIVSNAHVIAPHTWAEVNIGDSTLQPGSFFGGKDPEDKVGELLRFVEIKQPPETNIVDAACSKITVDFKEEIMEIGRVVGIRKANIGEEVIKSGYSGVTASKIIDTSATVKVFGYWGEDTFAIFENQLVAKPAFMIGGDSGSVWIGKDNRVVGLGFAGSSEVSIANDITAIVDLLNLEAPFFVMAGIPLLFGFTFLPMFIARE